MYPVMIRENSANGPGLTFAAAVRAAMGGDPHIARIYVTAVHAADAPGPVRHPGERAVYKAGDAVPGLYAEVEPRCVRYGDMDDALVSIGGIAGHSAEVAMLRAQAYVLAAQIAAAANAAAAAVAG
jgi:hypothetical protein